MREYLAHNSRVQPEARESEELSMTDISAQPRCLIGNEVRHSRNKWQLIEIFCAEQHLVLNI